MLVERIDDDVKSMESKRETAELFQEVERCSRKLAFVHMSKFQ